MRQMPAVTVDVVVMASRGGARRVLLVRRKNPPFRGQWALPGGFVEPQEPLEVAARRELKEETGLVPAHLQQLHTFGTPGRDPRGWTITVAYLARVDPEEASAWAPHAGTDATEVAWFDVDDLPSLAFDHAEILACARQAMDSGGPDA